MGVLVAFVGISYSASVNDDGKNGDDSTIEKTGQKVYVGNDNKGVINVVGGDLVYNFVKKNEISLPAADRKLESKDYAGAIEIYLQILEENPKNETALCNLGYLFKNGLGTEVDLERAIEYYDQAISLGNAQALCNELELCLENDTPIEKIGELLSTGLSAENADICKFVAASMQDNGEITSDEAISFCKGVKKISTDSIWSWKNTGLVKMYSTPEGTNTLRYTKVSVGTETIGDSASLYTIYRTEERYCPYIHLLQAGFIKET